MDITNFVIHFNELDFEKSRVISNFKTKSFWLTYELDPSNPKIFNGIHCRTFDDSNNFIARFYISNEETKSRLTIQYDDDVHSLRYVVHSDNNDIINDMTISYFDELIKSEEEFFQQSLVENYGELSYELSLKIDQTMLRLIEFIKGQS